MKLTDVSMSRAEREKQYEPAKAEADAPLYPWGLSLNLDNATIKKLDGVPMEVGEEVTIVARAKVTGCSSNATESGEHRSVSLQITKLGFTEESGDAAGKLYNGDKAAS